MGRTKFHVTKRKDGSWQGKKQGAQRASTVGSTKSSVVKETTKIAKKEGNSQVFIHKRDGKIQEERTYGNDPHPPKG